MIYISEEDRQRTALAREASHAFLNIVGWPSDTDPSMIPPILTEYSYVERANMVVGYWHKVLSLSTLIKSVADARVDLLLVEPTHPSTGRKTFYITLLLCRAGEVQIHNGLRLWSAAWDGPAYLVSDRDDRDEQISFLIHDRGVRQEPSLPFADVALEQSGLMTGDLRWRVEIGGHLV